MSRLVRARTAASLTPRSDAICVNGRRPSCCRCAMMRLSRGETSPSPPRAGSGLRARVLAGAGLVSAAAGGGSPPPDDAWVGAMPPEPIDIALQAAARAEGSPPSRAGISAATYDRVVRIVSYGFFIGTAIIVALGGLWATSAPAIYALLAGGAIVVFVVQDRKSTRLNSSHGYTSHAV